MRVYRVTTTRSLAAAGPLLVLEQLSGTVALVLISAKVTSDRGAGGTSEAMQVAIDHCDTAGSGNAATIQEINQGDSAADSVAHDGATTPPGYGDRIDAEEVNQVGGYSWDPALEERAEVAPGNGVAIRLLSTPTASTSYKTQLVFGEIG